jgi:UMP-CMP kinase
MSTSTSKPDGSTNKKLEVEVVFVLGPPGGGKGTNCKRLAGDFSWYHLSVGDYLRQLSNYPDSAHPNAFGGMTGDQLCTALQNRDLVPPETITSIIRHKLKTEKEKNGKYRFLIDGYPRQVGAARLFDEKITCPKAVLDLKCTKETAKSRFLTRKRGDDDDQIFEQRHAEFEKYHPAIIEHYHKLKEENGNGAKIVDVDVDGERDEVYKPLYEAVYPILVSWIRASENWASARADGVFSSNPK